uniref:Hephaestin n=1 Tax=Latimeria chalumnae TaxID=7897 RepID=H3BA63_LATCH
RMSQLLQAIVIFHLVLLSRGATRLYYIGIRELQWDYAPTGRNVISGQSITESQDASAFAQRGKDRIGGVYKKALYKQYSDVTYATEVQQPDWLGYLGPVIRAEVGDTIILHLKNFASRPYSLHPHGVFYDKSSEGALYPDHTSGEAKKDDGVPSGGSHTYTWQVTEEHEPTSDDPNCLTWIYHSHVDAPRDIASGLIGALLTCKRGVLDGVSLTRTDVDRDFILTFSVVDENLSWYLEDNIAAFCSNADSVDRENEEFMESNRMHSINGYVFGNLPNLGMCSGDSTSWHLFSIGNEVDVHTAFFHGQTMTVRGHKTDVVSLFPATFVTAEMVPSNVGKWLLSCQVNDHLKAGMQALFEVKECFKKSPKPSLTGRVRKYFIAAQEVQWNYGPLGIDLETGKNLEAPGSSDNEFFLYSSLYIINVYILYTRTPRLACSEGVSLSLSHFPPLGPVIKAEVGDSISVTFYNKASKTYSIQPHGVFYLKDSEGTDYSDGILKRGSSVEPLESITYNWTVPEHVGPTPSDPPCLTWMYYSAVDPVRDTNSGLIGPLIICKPGSLNKDNTQKGIGKEFYLLYTVFDENLSWYLRDSMQYASVDTKVDKEDEEFQESNKMHSINGFMFSNLPGLDLCLGENVSWHLMGLGTEVDVHSAMFHGNTIQLNGKRRDSANLFPHTFTTAFMQPDKTGTFGITCQTTSHFQAGMREQYHVSECNKDAGTSYRRYDVVRTHYIMAEEVEWDYSPNRTWELARHANPKSESYSNIFLSNEGGLIGSKYKKVVYREYTDRTFKIPKIRTPEEQHLGILGPLIQAEVGDIIMMVFLNNASRPYSVHAHGVFEASQGPVPATKPGVGEITAYQWNVPERSGPGPADPSCITWAYYSTVDTVKDLYSGLIGPLVTCRRGSLSTDGARTDVAREFALLFLVFDENQSWYLEDNVKTYAGKEPNEVDLRSESFVESNKMHAINGKLYGNVQGLTMHQGDRVDWYLLGMGDEIDLHTVHFHAETFTYLSRTRHRADVFDLFPGTFQTVEMVTTNLGTWLLHCHVDDHLHAGMETMYTVLPTQVCRHHRVHKVVTKNVEINSVSDDDTGHNVLLFGKQVAQGKAELVLTILVVGGLVLLLVVIFLVGVIYH